jgi:hypothetical protein
MNVTLLATSLVLFAGLIVGVFILRRKRTTPDRVVARLVEAITTGGDFTEDDLYAAMARAGIPDSDADRAFKFTQVAWGRELLVQIGLSTPPPDYACFNAVGDVIESGLLSEDPYYIAAMKAAQIHVRSSGFKRFAMMSSDFHVVNNAVRAGSKLENLEVSPPVLFLEPPTEAGLEKARRFITERLRSRRGASDAKPAASSSGPQKS